MVILTGFSLPNGKIAVSVLCQAACMLGVEMCCSGIEEEDSLKKPKTRYLVPTLYYLLQI